MIFPLLLILLVGCASTPEVQELDYSMHVKQLNKHCYEVCVKNNTKTECKLQCTEYNRKLYQDIYYNVTCPNLSFKLVLHTGKNLSVPALYPIISDNCTFEGYGHFVGWTY